MKKEKKPKKPQFYSLDRILPFNADYNIIIGQRSNGKTTSVQRYALEQYVYSDYTQQLGIVRRWETDFKGKNGQQMFENVVALGWVEELTNGEYNSIYYYSQRWWLVKYNTETGEKEKQDNQPFAFGFSLNSQEHYKSTSYPNITTILFDEFLTATYYMPDEFITFQNLLSTIIRQRDNVKIFMCGNTINKYCPYFSEMGLYNIKNQEQNTIDLYTYGEGKLRVAVEYCDVVEATKKANKYFAFDNPKLKMITEGAWEVKIHPHLPVKYAPKNIEYIFFIEFDRELMQGEIIRVEDKTFLYIHRKTTPIKEDTKQLVYKQEPDFRPNYRTNILRPYSKADKFILTLISREKIFYQDNEIGELFINYIKWCEQN